ncbi:hypothetical protein GGI12_001403 [Dipsacomyces acuminosporus]|nr:hypothetical protein GGI12_001403 [Dipsacomyces acuminosporus]
MLLDRNGDVRLADFTATEFSSEALAAMRAECPEFDPNSYPPYADFCGTIPYSAPEALSPALGANLKTKDAIHKMDIYSLGVSLYSLFVSGREPYASVKSSVEQMLFATKGAFWEWEERQYLAAMSSSLPQAPKVPHPLERHNTDAGIRSHPSLSLELGPRPRRRRTLKSRKAAPREFLRFLSGDPLPPDIESLLRDMANPNPSLRPTAGEILARLDSVEPEIFEP